MHSTLKSFLITGALLAATPALAAGGHGGLGGEAPAWTPSTLRAKLVEVERGDARRGQELHRALMCASCHGDGGVAPSRNYPSLAGQRAEYTYKQLIDYRDARRHEGTGQAEIMVKIAQLMTEQDMRDVAAYYASLPAAAPLAAEDGSGEVLRLVRHGDPVRLITPCASCHGVQGEGGVNETPALAGQVHEYFVRTMQAFRRGARDNDLYDGMGQFVHDLDDAEIEALAAYYAGVKE